jgi:predicted secreted protein
MCSTFSHNELAALEDDRSKRVIFVSHCLLNENTRYAGGAFRSGGIDELTAVFQRAGLGIVQMRCPEQCAWGGVRKRHILAVYGSRGSLIFRLLPVLVPLFLWYTRVRYWFLAGVVARDIDDYLGSGYSVAGVVGVGGSPSCGVCTTLDLQRSLGVLASCPASALNRGIMNEQAIIECLRPGEGLFVTALRRQLRLRHRSVVWYEHELLDEIRGQPIQLRRASPA